MFNAHAPVYEHAGVLLTETNPSPEIICTPQLTKHKTKSLWRIFQQVVFSDSATQNQNMVGLNEKQHDQSDMSKPESLKLFLKLVWKCATVAISVNTVEGCSKYTEIKAANQKPKLQLQMKTYFSYSV